jgi:dTDP-4-dehydrorhamnose reductase
MFKIMPGGAGSDYAGKKILIIGAQGMLGQYLAQELTNDNLYLWDREGLDITQVEDVAAKIKDLKPEIIINTAAYNDVDGAEKNEEIANLVNGEGPGYLAAAAQATGAILVHYSSDYVFAGEKVEGYQEDDRPSPISKYGYSKYLGEQRVVNNCNEYYLIRLSRLFGKMGVGLEVKKSFVDKILELAQSKKELEIINEEVSSPTYAKDLAEFTKALLISGEPYGIYHGANSGGCTWYELAQEIFKIKGLDIKLIPVAGDKFPRAAKRPAHSILLNTKFISIRSWREALEDYLERN